MIRASDNIIRLQGLASDTKPTFNLRTRATFTDEKNNIDLWNGTGWTRISQAGAKLVRPILGTGETTKNRNIAAAATTHPGSASNTNTDTWTALENVTEVVIDGGGNGRYVVFDALSGDDAKALLEDSGGLGLDVQYKYIAPGTVETFTGTSYFSRVDVLPVNAADARTPIGAQ